MCEKKQKISLVGIGMGTTLTMTAQAEKAVRSADCLIGARRMLEAVRDLDAAAGKPALAEYRGEEILSYIQSHPEYREIADEAFARCYEQLERYQGRSRFSGWVGGYSKNITRTRCRQILTGMRYRRQLYERSTGRFMDWDPLWLLLRLERDACLWRAISDISETGWRILEARALEQLTFRDIARELQLTRREVQTRYEAVCTAVRRRYLRYCEERTL